MSTFTDYAIINSKRSLLVVPPKMTKEKSSSAHISMEPPLEVLTNAEVVISQIIVFRLAMKSQLMGITRKFVSNMNLMIWSKETVFVACCAIRRKEEDEEETKVSHGIVIHVVK